MYVPKHSTYHSIAIQLGRAIMKVVWFAALLAVVALHARE
jgi:uncharacterized protein YhhL (DUF1145 family)